MATDYLRLLMKDLAADIAADRRVAKKPGDNVDPRPSIYADPRNWIPGKVIKLVHETGMDLGYFQVWRHTTSITCRRLLPYTGPAMDCEGVETVSGKWWLEPKMSAPGTPTEEKDHRELVARWRDLMEDHMRKVD